MMDLGAHGLVTVGSKRDAELKRPVPMQAYFSRVYLEAPGPVPLRIPATHWRATRSVLTNLRLQLLRVKRVDAGVRAESHSPAKDKGDSGHILATGIGAS